MTRLCPSGGQCPSQRCVNYLRGRRCLVDDEREHTHDEIAAELRISPSHVRRLEATSIAKLLAKLDPANLSSVKASISAPPRRFSDNPTEHHPNAPLAPMSPESPPHLVTGQRAEQITIRKIPKRFQ